MARKAKKDENYLDYIPAVSTKNSWDADAEGNVTIHMVHRGFYAWIAQKIFHRPRVSHIALDEMGSFIFPLIDGKQQVRERFGADAEPLYERLAKYMQILRNNGFIYYAGKDRAPQ